jgi:hypothetical protein
MELVIRIALMFFFIQFLVVVTVMSAALLLARSEVSGWSGDPGRNVITRGAIFTIHLPARGFRSIVRMVQSMYLRSVH